AKLPQEFVEVNALGAEVDGRSAGPSLPAPEATEAALWGEAEAVVLLPLFLVAEDIVGVLDFLEPGLGLLVARVTVRMVLPRQLAVGAFDFVFAGAARHAEHFVGIARHGSVRNRLGTGRASRRLYFSARRTHGKERPPG